MLIYIVVYRMCEIGIIVFLVIFVNGIGRYCMVVFCVLSMKLLL